MSEAHDILSDIVEDRASATTDPVLNLRTGVPFTAEIDGSPDAFTISAELGEDAREAILLHVTDPDEAAAQFMNDTVRFTLFGKTVVYKLVKRRANDANPQTDFWAVKVVAGIDT